MLPLYTRRYAATPCHAGSRYAGYGYASDTLRCRAMLCQSAPMMLAV